MFHFDFTFWQLYKLHSIEKGNIFGPLWCISGRLIYKLLEYIIQQLALNIHVIQILTAFWIICRNQMNSYLLLKSFSKDFFSYSFSVWILGDVQLGINLKQPYIWKSCFTNLTCNSCLTTIKTNVMEYVKTGALINQRTCTSQLINEWCLLGSVVYIYMYIY